MILGANPDPESFRDYRDRLPLPLFCLRSVVFDKKIQPGKKSSVQVGAQVSFAIKGLYLKSGSQSIEINYI